ncbi:TBC domain protein [Aspergillus heteromorphus CBS 117.55]|uniref:TBC domain protein n=1 Tax=Aspergillus heteromorphus CBS 117.55 TaxID=1448321 RepID=A0A317WXD7_9EURO|nr:TBC domain protein [Aspergillus heteromorphus CBS 117.55]PWY91076.1 TBC domain protein [Aspergillus heteromorphus CBS 117.55]
MRGIEETRQRWDALFRDHDTTADFRTTLRSEQGDKLCDEGLRSVCWKAFLLFDDLARAQWPQKITDSRSAYVALKAHFLKYIEHPDDLQSTVDPLADDEESPWQTLRDDEQTRADISQDVDRCLQENFFFREPTTKAKMIDILFIYSKLNPDLGYRQGMHEILAPLLWAVDRDAIEPTSLQEPTAQEADDAAMRQLLDANYVEHDSFALFCSVMQTVRMYYEHNRHRSENGQADVIPIVHQCERLHNELLVTADVELADHLQAIDILPQIFLTRWMRLLFGREFSFQEVLVIWDRLFAEGLRPELIDFTCVAMLLRIRWQLLSADSSGALSMLLRYPPPHPHAALSFVQDGMYLEQNPTPDRGIFIISKYSGRPPDVTKAANQKPSKKFRLRSVSRDLSESSSPSRSPARNSPKSLETLFQDVSEGIQRRTETWGVAKAVRGAVSEAKRNMQSIQSEHYPRSTGMPWDHGSDAASQWKAKIEQLEERNRKLAKNLSHALNDIRSHMMRAESIDKKTTDALKQALTQVQSVQSCLEDPSIPPGSVKQPLNEPQNGDQESLSEQSKSPNGHSETEAEKADSASTATGKVSVSATSSGSSIASERKPSIASSSAPMPASMPLRHAARPSLAESEFSWMLGGGRHISSFVSPASVPPEQTRHGEMRAKPGALFNNGDEEHGRFGAEPDGMALRSLRGPKPRE